MPVVQHILETSLEVSDLERSEVFYRRLFNFSTVMATDRMRVLSIRDREVLLLFVRGKSAAGELTPGGFIPGHNASGQMHVAFAVQLADMTEWRKKLEANGIAIESFTNPPKGGESLYFRDPDQHLIELATPAIWGFES